MKDLNDIREADLPRLPGFSVLARPMRMLFSDKGTPLGRVHWIGCETSSDLSAPLGSFCVTNQGRLIFWPAWPHGADTIRHNDDQPIPDHFTLELGDLRTHATRFDESGKRTHYKLGWRIIGQPSNARVWLVYAVKITVLKEQVGQFSWRACSPVADWGRREHEARRYWNQLQRHRIPVPDPRWDYLLAIIYLLPDVRDWLTNRTFSRGPWQDEWIDGWVDGGFDVGCYSFRIGGKAPVNLGIALASPFGTLRGEVFVGAPTQWIESVERATT